MISILINRAAVARDNEFGRSNEYIFIVFLGGASPAKMALESEWNRIENTTKEGVHWVNLCRTGTNSRRQDRPGMFYPIFVSEDGKKIVGLGDVLPLEQARNTVVPPDGCVAVWPLHSDGSEGRWMQGKDSLEKLISKGYVRLGKFTKTGMAVSYLNRAQIEKIESGDYVVELLPVLWLKAGAHGPCPALEETAEVPAMLVLPVNHFAVLTDESQYEEFAARVNGEDSITTVYIVTDSEPGYREMVSGLHAEDTYQLYRDYLDNFRINHGGR